MRKADTQSLTETCSLPFQSDMFWVLPANGLMWWAEGHRVWALSLCKASDLSMGLVPPHSSGKNCSCCNPICSLEIPPRAHHLRRVSQSYRMSLGCVSGSRMKRKIQGLGFHTSAHVHSLQLSDIPAQWWMICQLPRLYTKHLGYKLQIHSEPGDPPNRSLFHS